MKPLVAMALAVTFLSVGCSHTVNFKSEPPGAEVYIDGQKVGTTPFAYEEKTAGSGQVEVIAKQGGKEKKTTVLRNNLAAMPVAAGAGAGAGACVVLSCGSIVLGFITYGLCWVGTLPALLLIPAGAAGGWFLYGNQMPDTVTIDMKDATPSGAPAAGVPPPSAAY
jgi:PEGA domain